MLSDLIEKTFKRRFVINLAHRKDRLNEFKNRSTPFFDPGLVERFDAIYGKNIDLTTFATEPFIKNARNKAEVGCFLSHRNIWGIVSDDKTLNDDDLVLIFEDDVFFSKNIENKLKDAMEEFQKIKHPNKFLYIGGRFTENFFPTNQREVKHH